MPACSLAAMEWSLAILYPVGPRQVRSGTRAVTERVILAVCSDGEHRDGVGGGTDRDPRRPYQP